MNIATKPKPTSLTERIAKVRNRMLIADLTKVSPFNKELFVVLCQIHEEHNTEKSSSPSDLSDDSSLSLQSLSFAYEIRENIWQRWPECVLMKNFSQGPAEDFSDNLGNDDFTDWDPGE